MKSLQEGSALQAFPELVSSHLKCLRLKKALIDHPVAAACTPILSHLYNCANCFLRVHHLTTQWEVTVRKAGPCAGYHCIPSA